MLARASPRPISGGARPLAAGEGERGSQVRGQGAGQFGLDQAQFLHHVQRRVEPLQAVLAVRGERDAVGAKPRPPALELGAVGDVQAARAFLDGAVQVRDPHLQNVQRHGLGERVHFLVDHRAAVGRRGVDDPVDGQGGEIHQPQGGRRRGGVLADGVHEVAQQHRDPRPEPVVRRDRHAVQRGVEAIRRVSQA